MLLRLTTLVINDTYSYELEQWDETRMETVKGELVSKITIVDRGYRASGSNGPTSYRGVICSLEKPFELTGKHPLFTFPFKFVPSSATAGTASYSASWSVTKATGSGPYTIEGADTDAPRIVWPTQSTLNTPVVTTGGGGAATINLTPLETAECN